jgi:hypothetical protein
MLEAALAYAAEGWRIFPCHTPVLVPGQPPQCSCTKRGDCAQIGKHPRTMNGLTDATNDPVTVRRWWTTFPDANIGGIPASAGLLAFDLDTEAAHAAAREIGLYAEPTREVITGNGVHRYYRHPVALPSGAAVRGIIVRSGHGYVMLPPSLHKNGTRYRWEPEGGEILPLPPKALAAVQEATSKSGAAERVKIAASADRITAGDRHSHLLTMAGSLAARAVLPEMALSLVQSMNAARCDPPKDPSEVQRIVEFAYGKELAKPAEPAPPEPPPMEWAPLDTAVPVGDSEDDDEARTAALPRPPRLRDLLSAAYSLDQWAADLVQMQSGTPTHFDALDDLGLRWLPGKLTAVIARPGGGKTAFMLEACARFLEHETEQYAVFLSWEEPVTDLVTRLIQRADARMMRQGQSFRDRPLPMEAIRANGRGDDVAPPYRPRIAAARAEVALLLRRLRIVDGDQLGRDVRGVLRELAAWMRDEGAPTVGLVSVDYFQKLRGREGHSRQSELQDVSDALRRFAKGATLQSEHDAPDPRFAVPVIVGAQVNRSASATYKDSSGHPTGDDIREADDLLNDAAAVVSLSWETTGGGDDDTARALRVAVPKHRGGRSRGAAGDEVAKITWHPARHWIADAALRDGGRIRWSDPKADGTESNDPAPKNHTRTRGLIPPPSAPLTLHGRAEDDS